MNTKPRYNAKIIVFSGVNYTGSAHEIVQTDPDLPLSSTALTIASAIVVRGSWTFWADTQFAGGNISLLEAGGPEADGVYQDFGDWAGMGAFVAKSCQHG